MTEKSYGGNNGVREHLNKKPIKTKISTDMKAIQKKDNKILSQDLDSDEDINKYIQAGKIAQEVKIFARKFIKKDMLLLIIAENIESEIIRLGGKLAFPVNLSIDSVAAHFNPSLDDITLANGLLKIDFGVHIDGFIADTAISLDLTPDKKHTLLIKASVDALESAIALLKKDPDSTLDLIGGVIHDSIKKLGFSPIINLSGHGISRYNIHDKVTIPNYANNSKSILLPGTYAIEPFATTGIGKVINGTHGNIYSLIQKKNPRGKTARDILEFISTEYKTLPFSQKEIIKKFGPLSRLGLKELQDSGTIHSYPQLIESSREPVSQAEHTFIKTKDNKIIITT